MFDYPVAGASVPVTGPTAEGADVALKEYDVVINNVATTVQLDEVSARRMGVWRDSPEVKQAAPKQNKARKPRNKSGDGA